MQHTHPDADVYISSGVFCVQRSSRGFSRSPVDQAKEQTNVEQRYQNKRWHCWFQSIKGSVKRWFDKIAHERASISSKCRDLAGMVNPETSAQKLE